MIMWLVFRSNGSKEPYTIEMVLMDDKRGKIQASVTQKHFNKFKKYLKEGKTYMFRMFWLLKMIPLTVLRYI
ncbi:hypothetical protein ABFS83_03G029700 [Erythranthe nasuta]